MKFYTFGDISRPAIVMLSGSFCPAVSLDYLYGRLKENYYVIVPEYNGHYENSKDFSTRRNEAAEIKDHLARSGLTELALIYGQSMGAEIAIELTSQLLADNIAVKHAVFDGAPCIRLSGVYKYFMYIKFRVMINMMRKKTVDDVISWKFLNQFTNGDTESLRPALESLKKISPYITDASIKNETECCYTFDFPKFSEEFQKNMHFFYAAEEKAYKSCIKHVRSAYPQADYRVENGYGHLTYSVKNTDGYLAWIEDILRK